MGHKFGFDFGDPYYSFEGLEFAFRVCTLENVYGIDPGRATVTNREEGLRIKAKSLQFAGGQRYCPGEIVADIRKDEDTLKFSVKTRHREIVKGVTILIKGLATPVDEEKIAMWPTPDPAETPFPEIETVDGGTVSIMPATTGLRFRRWAVYQAYAGYRVLNLSEDEAYTKRSNQMTGIEWTLIRNPAPGTTVDTWYKMLEHEQGLRRWEDRTDVPAWFREVGLVLNMHCEGWTGYVFNTFDRQLEILSWIGKRIEGRRVLVYLPGWDGRYYWNYPVYEPSEACGGREGLRRLIDGAHDLGMHVTPMFGLIASNYDRTRAMGFQQAVCRTAYDLEEICDWTEWDEDLATEPSWQSLNVGERTFREHLLRRISWVTDTFGSDGAMLDISGWMPRDPRHDMLDGLSKLIKALHARYDDFFIFGENGSELHMALIPLFHHAAHLDSDHPFHRYCRTAYHLYTGAPGRGSTGVFESGYNPYVPPSPDSPAIPTLSVVQDTLPDHEKEVEEIIDIASKWAERWL